MKRIILFLIVFTVTINCKVPIYIYDGTEDTIGSSLLYQFKERIRTSSSYEITYIEGDAVINIRFSSIKKDTYSTVYSIIWTIPNFYATAIYPNNKTTSQMYLDNTFGYCGNIYINETAQNLVVRTDKLITALTKIFQNLNK